jgi:hypothetical protein
MLLSPLSSLNKRTNEGVNKLPRKHRRVSIFHLIEEGSEQYEMKLVTAVPLEKVPIEVFSETEIIENVVLEMKRLLMGLGYVDESVYVVMSDFLYAANRIAHHDTTVNEYKKVVAAAAAAAGAAIKRTTVFDKSNVSLKQALVAYDDAPDHPHRNLADEWFRAVASATAIAVAKTYKDSSQKDPTTRPAVGFRNVVGVSRRAGMTFFKEVADIVAAAADRAFLSRNVLSEVDT